MTPIDEIIENEILSLYLAIKGIITYQAEKNINFFFLPEERMGLAIMLLIHPRSEFTLDE